MVRSSCLRQRCDYARRLDICVRVMKNEDAKFGSLGRTTMARLFSGLVEGRLQRLTLGAVQDFRVPRHLDGLEFAFI